MPLEITWTILESIIFFKQNAIFELVTGQNITVFVI